MQMKQEYAALERVAFAEFLPDRRIRMGIR
jgi:hypothetical protein